MKSSVSDGGPVPKEVLAQALRAVLILLAMGVFAGFVASVWFQQTDGSAPIPWEVIGVGWFSAALVALVAERFPQAPLMRALAVFSKEGSGVWPAILLGMALRLSFALIVAPQPASDGATYLSLAQQLVSDGTYGSEGARAFWPPGLPLLLTPLLWLGLPKSLAVLVLGLLSFVAAALGMWNLAHRLGLQAWSSLPVWLLALWPTHILCAGLPEKELLIIALMPWIVDRAIVALNGSMPATCVAGALTGMAVLVQPSLQLLPIAAVLAALLLRRSVVRVIAGGVVGALSMLVLMSPWAYHNYQTFGSLVLVSTNGGDVMYRANNEKATGAYTRTGAVDLNHLDELSFDSESKRLAFRWIQDHPAQFIQLSMGKILLFLGDDSFGAFTALRRGKPDTPSHVYLAVKLVCAVPWLLAWFVVLAMMTRKSLDPKRNDIRSAWMVVLPVLYLWGIHAIFESGPRYHLPVLALVLMLVGLAARNAGLQPEPASFKHGNAS